MKKHYKKDFMTSKIETSNKLCDERSERILICELRSILNQTDSEPVSHIDYNRNP